MKTINLKGITESLSESEMKMVKGGFDVIALATDQEGAGAVDYCYGHSSCRKSSDCPGSQLCTDYGIYGGKCCR